MSGLVSEAVQGAGPVHHQLFGHSEGDSASWPLAFFFLKKKDVRQAEAVATLMREAHLLHENEHAVKAGGQLLLQQFLYCAELSTETEGS